MDAGYEREAGRNIVYLYSDSSKVRRRHKFGGVFVRSMLVKRVRCSSMGRLGRGQVARIEGHARGPRDGDHAGEMRFWYLLLY